MSSVSGAMKSRAAMHCARSAQPTACASAHPQRASAVWAPRQNSSARSPRAVVQALVSHQHASAAGRRSVKVAAAPPSTEESFIECNLPKPLGLKFARGNDGGAYIIAVDPRVGNVDEKLQPGDKIVQVSASFGSDVWEALNYGQVMYAIKTRNGEVYLKVKQMFGDMSALEEQEMTEAEKMWQQERAGGNYGAGTQEIQQQRYVASKELERKRRELFDDALQKFRQGEMEAALIDFENVLAMEPKYYLGDDFSRVTQIYRVTQYNIACCYGALGQDDAGLEALQSCMMSGFEDFKKIRTDPNLAGLRKSPKFTPLLEKFDEPIINREAIDAIKGFFSFGKKSE